MQPKEAQSMKLSPGNAAETFGHGRAAGGAGARRDAATRCGGRRDGGTRPRPRLVGHRGGPRAALAAEPADCAVDLPVVAVPAARVVGPGPHGLLQRRLRPGHGRDKHPAALGRPAAEVWPEAWHELGPMAASVLAGRGATYSEDQQLFLRRHGYLRRPTGPSPTRRSRTRAAGSAGCLRPSPRRRAGWSGSGGCACWATSVSSRRAGRRPRGTGAVVGVLARHALTSRSWRPTCARRREPAARPGSSGVAAGGAVARRTMRGRGGSVPSRFARVVANGGPRSASVASRSGAARSGCSPPAARGPGRRRRRCPTLAGRSEPAGVVVAGREPVPGARRRLPLVLRPGGRPARHRGRGCAGLRGRAEAGRSARRAGPGQDGLLLQRQPRVPHPADADPGPGRGAARRARRWRTHGCASELDVVHRNALRLGKLVNTLLDFSRLQAGRVEAHFEPVDLAASPPSWPASSARPSSGPGSGTRRLPPLAEPVYVDRDMWEKIVLNLLSNA